MSVLLAYVFVAVVVRHAHSVCDTKFECLSDDVIAYRSGNCIIFNNTLVCFSLVVEPDVVYSWVDVYVWVVGDFVLRFVLFSCLLCLSFFAHQQRKQQTALTFSTGVCLDSFAVCASPTWFHKGALVGPIIVAAVHTSQSELRIYSYPSFALLKTLRVGLKRKRNKRPTKLRAEDAEDDEVEGEEEQEPEVDEEIIEDDFLVHTMMAISREGTFLVSASISDHPRLHYWSVSPTPPI